jgi:hypothetical protein
MNDIGTFNLFTNIKGVYNQEATDAGFHNNIASKLYIELNEDNLLNWKNVSDENIQKNYMSMFEGIAFIVLCSDTFTFNDVNTYRFEKDNLSNIYCFFNQKLTYVYLSSFR